LFFIQELAGLNLFAVFTGFILSWYFGETDFDYHPDRLIGSLVGYIEKSVYRQGTAREGLKATLISIALTFAAASIILTLVKNAGLFWYFVFSVFFIYSSANSFFQEHKTDSNLFVGYLYYAAPVLLYSALFGPAAALIYRVLPVMKHMNGTRMEPFREYGKPAEKALEWVNKPAELIVPLIVIVTGYMRRFVRYVKSFRP